MIQRGPCNCAGWHVGRELFDVDSPLQHGDIELELGNTSCTTPTSIQDRYVLLDS